MVKILVEMGPGDVCAFHEEGGANVGYDMARVRHEHSKLTHRTRLGIIWPGPDMSIPCGRIAQGVYNMARAKH